MSQTTRARRPVAQSELTALAAITLLAALLRFPTLDVQSLWLDEAVSAQMVAGDLGELFHSLEFEASPPLYYLLAFGWTKLFGTGEVAFRSLSALAGVLTVPVVFLAARELGGRRAGVIGAALAAVSPALVWYSQEGRTYALTILLTGLGFLFFLRALKAGGSGALAWWAALSAAAIATHYFAVFLVGVEAVWLVAARADRGRVIGFSAIPVLTGLALLPLVAVQREQGVGAHLGNDSLAGRVTGVPELMLLGEKGPPFTGAFALAFVLAALGAVLLFTHPRGSTKRLALVAGGVGVAACAVPVLLAVAGLDYVYPRNLLIAWIPLAVALSVALGSPHAPRVGVALSSGLVLVGLVTAVLVVAKPDLQRDDWRGGLNELGPPGRARLMVMIPPYDRAAVQYYAPSARRVGEERLRVDEVDLIRMSSDRVAAPRPPPGFLHVATARKQRFTAYRYRAPGATSVDAGQVARRFGAEPQGVLVERRGAAPEPFRHPSDY